MNYLIISIISIICLFRLFKSNKSIVGIPSHEEYPNYTGSAHFNVGRRNKFKRPHMA